MSKHPGTSGNMPAEKAGCGMRPSKDAMETGFSVDFSKAKDLMQESQNPAKNQTNQVDNSHTS